MNENMKLASLKILKHYQNMKIQEFQEAASVKIFFTKQYSSDYS